VRDDVLVRRRRWWWGWLSRAPLGWRLLGWVLFVVCVALPVWVLTAGDLEMAARWAPVLGLPLTALGLALVLADRDRGQAAREAVDSQRRPWMAPPLDRMVERPELGDRLVAALTAPFATEVGLTTGLAGAGGFGKTRLATWVCHHPEIERRYPGGLLWATVGQEVRGADLAARINDLAFALCGERPAISDPDTAGAELGRLLDEHEPVLLVVDDVWENAQLRPFRFGGRCCTRLVTTRIPDLLPDGGARIAVDAMSGDQARRLVADGVVGLPAEMAERLAELAGRWPVLLNLVNGALRRRVTRGQPSQRAATEIIEALVAEGPVAFDPARPADRGRAVAATVEASLVLLEAADRERYLDLTIFPEDVDIPLDVLALLWPGCRVDGLCEDLVGLGLAADYRLDPPGPRLALHDVMRAYLQTRRNLTERRTVHERLINAAAALLPTNDDYAPPWWLLPTDAGYLWRYVPHHLHHAGRIEELARLTCDLRWVEAKTQRFGSPVTAEADLELVNTPSATTLRRVLRQIAPLLGPIDPPTALGATLASRLHGVPELHAILDRYRATLAHPLLEPAWPLPDQPELTQASRSGHTGAVTGCAFSPDGALLATASQDGTVRLWQVADRSMRAVLTGHTGGVWGCAFSPDGALLATTGDDRTVRLWHVPTGAEVNVLTGHTDWVTSCAFSPNGNFLATTSADGTARLWQLTTGTAQAVLSGHASAVRDCAFHTDGALLATAGEDGTTRLWSVATGAEVNVLTGHASPGGVWHCAFSPDGTLLATAGDDRTVRLWHVATGTERALLAGHSSRVDSCTFSPDGATLATASEATVRLWHIATGTVQVVLAGHSASVFGCMFSPDGTLLATAGNDGARLWHVADGSTRAVLTGIDTKVDSCSFSQDGTLLATTGEDDTVRLWQVPDGREQHTLIGHSSRVTHCTFSADGTTLATTSNDGTIRLWRVPDGTTHAVLTGHTGRVRSCAFSPDGTLLATTSIDRTVRLWQVADGSERATLTGHTDAINGCAFSPDGTLLATAGDDRTLRLWKLPDATAHAVLTGHTDIVNSCAFSPDGAVLATTSDDRTLRLWKPSDGGAQAVLTGHITWVEGCTFSPDGTLLASASYDGTVRLWDVASGRCHCALRVAGPLIGIAWHPAGTMLCTVGGAGVYMLNYLP
jgi:WD40 repeat protein